MAGQLPQEGYTDFVGRQDELTGIAKLLGASRLVTIAGPGGVGKTRVALVAAAQAADSYPDGPWIVELSGLRDPLLLPNTVASVLGLPQQDARSALDLLLEYLRDKRLLLILDTCEHLLDACAGLVQAVLREAPGVTVLATSRQPLDMQGEHTFQVGPLPVPAPDSGAPTADGGDAVELFTLRACAAVPDFSLTADNFADVVRACRRLDGIPLAIELAAVQLRTLPLAELVDRLNHRFDVLLEGRPDALARHQTLRTAIEWSYDLCSPAERRLWARLSVFAGTFSLAAAEEVCAEVSLEAPDVIESLIGLVDKSVVLREGETYRMLDTVREFGAERLAASGELASCRARHIALYLAMAQGFGSHFGDGEQIARYRELRAVHSNLRAALEYALEPEGAVAPGASAAAPPSAALPSAALSSAERGRWRSGAEIACSLFGYWQISCLLGEGGYWLTKVLERFPETGPERAQALVDRGYHRTFMGALDDALSDLEAGTAMGRMIGDPVTTARGYQHMQLALTFAGRHDEAVKAADEAWARLRACGYQVGLLMLAAQHGHLYHLSGRPDLAVAACEEGLAMLGPASGEQWVTTYLYYVYGIALFQMPGREADCDVMLRKALAGKQELGDLIGMAYALDALGWLSARTGSPSRTAWLLGAAEPLWERSGSVRFSGTAIMERFHQQAAATAADLLGEACYAANYAAGAAYVKGQLAARVGEAALRLEIP